MKLGIAEDEPKYDSVRENKKRQEFKKKKKRNKKANQPVEFFRTFEASNAQSRSPRRLRTLMRFTVVEPHFSASFGFRLTPCPNANTNPIRFCKKHYESSSGRFPRYASSATESASFGAI